MQELDLNQCYELPLAPQHLVQIYKDKESIEDYILWVDYEKTKEKLSPQHIIIYLANTNFKTTFSAIDDDLIKAYIQSDFMVDCPLLARIVVLLIKVKYQHEIFGQEAELLPIFDMERLIKFNEQNEELMDKLVATVASSVPFALSKFYNGLPPEIKEKEVNLNEFLDLVEVTDAPPPCGPNIARLLTVGFDALLLILSKEGLSVEYNKQLYNDSPKYFGKDLYFIMCETKLTDQIISFFPEDFILNASAT